MRDAQHKGRVLARKQSNPLPVNIVLLSDEALISGLCLRDAPKRDGNKLTSATEGQGIVVAFFQGLTS